MSKGVIIGGAIALAAVAFVAGAFIGPQIPFVASVTGADQFPGPGGATGGPMAQLTDEQRAQMQNMTEEERRVFLQEQMGGSAPAGGPGGTGSRGGMSLEGEIIEVAADSLTVKTANGGSQTIYFDDTTTVGYAKDVEQGDLAVGNAVIVVVQPEADNVLSATAVLVK